MWSKWKQFFKRTKRNKQIKEIQLLLKQKLKSTNALKNMWHFTFICCVKRYIYCIQRQHDVESNMKTFSSCRYPKMIGQHRYNWVQCLGDLSCLELVSIYLYMQHSGRGNVILTASSRKWNNLSGIIQTLTVLRPPVRLINMETLMTWHIPRQSSWICVCFKYPIINRSLIVVLVSDDKIYPEALSRWAHTTGPLTWVEALMASLEWCWVSHTPFTKLTWWRHFKGVTSYNYTEYNKLLGG